MATQLAKTQVASVLQQLVVKQGRKCAICGQPFSGRDGAVLDHDHTTGYIRGAVHRSCNGAEGKIKTKAHLGHKGVAAYDLLIGLGKYLELHKTPRYPFIHPSHLTEAQKRELRNKKARLARVRKKSG